MAGQLPPGSERYSDIVYGTIDIDKLNCLIKNQPDVRVDQASELSSPPNLPQQYARSEPILAQVCPINSTIMKQNAITTDLAQSIINNSTDI
jgi:hypothetical protein